MVRRRERLEESRAALAKSERLQPAIEMIRSEALGIGAWAHERYERNHLTDLFLRGRS